MFLGYVDKNNLFLIVSACCLLEGLPDMNLLPKSHEEFSSVNYWNEFFKKRGKKAFEWYGEYPELCGQLLKYIKPKDDVLVVGCGNSTLSMDLYNVGYKNIVSIDISKIVIKQMNDKNKNERPDLIYECMDATAMTYPDDKFSVVLDKGTFDALMPDSTEETVNTINKYLSEISRVLRQGGRYVCISLLQQHILHKLVTYFPSNEFMFRVARCYEAEAKSREDEAAAFPVFVVIATKFPGLPRQVLELALTENKIVRVDDSEEIMTGVLAAQRSALICNTLSKRNIADVGEVTLDLHTVDNDQPRYTVHIVDKPGIKSAESYAAFIVPQGRDTDWIFGMPEGRQALLKKVSKDRLAVITLRRDHNFESMERVREELGPSVKYFAPLGLPANYVINFLSLGEAMGNREIRCKGESKISGPYVVEDVLSDEGHTHRRLIFLNDQFIVQSEARLRSVKCRHRDRKQKVPTISESSSIKGKKKLVIDHGFLACEHHPYMCVGVNAAIKFDVPSEVLVVGLGGGGLCSFLHECFPKLRITAVDIDEEILRIATQWFDLTLDKRMKVEIADGLEFIKQASTTGRKFDAILFDVDSKDKTIGISCPPKSFLEPAVLRDVANCLNDSGFFILNLVCRDKSLRQNILDEVKASFASLSTLGMDDHLNEIFVCSMMKRECEDFKNILIESTTNLNRRVKSMKYSTDHIIDLSSLLEFLSVES